MKRCVLFDIEIERREEHQINTPTKSVIKEDNRMDPLTLYPSFYEKND